MTDGLAGTDDTRTCAKCGQTYRASEWVLCLEQRNCGLLRPRGERRTGTDRRRRVDEE